MKKEYYMEISMEQFLHELSIKQSFSNDWVVYIYNDDTTPINYVIDVLVNIFDYNMHKASVFAYDVSDSEFGIVGKYPEKLAKVRVEKALNYIHSKGYTDFNMEAKEDN